MQSDVSLNDKDIMPIQYVHTIFQECASRFENNIALIFNDEEITYQELDKRSNQFALYLKKMGLNNGNVVGLLLEPSVSVYITMLAVLKAGATYTPIDPECPKERINYILTDCQASMLITSNYFIKKHRELDYNVLLIEQINHYINSESVQSFDFKNSNSSPEDICYIIYTSGSTGKPKGVKITHRSVVHFIKAAREVYGIHSEDRVYQGFSISFDASVEEIWLTLTSGAILVPAVDQTLRAGGGLVEFLTRNQISVLSCVPTLLEMLEPPIPSLRLLIVGGEVCPQHLVKRWSRLGLRILNTYGPTEATVVATYSECYPDIPVTIGHPLPGYDIYLLNCDLKPVPLGEEGEIYIGGKGLAVGYVNLPEMNKDKFIIYPDNGERLYRSGDLAYRDENSALHYVGRIDNQVKLRGFRIELQEVEEVILQFPGVMQAVADVQELNPGMQSLIIYLVLEQGIDIDLIHLKEFVVSRLPSYMRPNAFEIIKSLPLLLNGKVDRKKLPKPQLEIRQEHTSYVAPNTLLEKKITEVWQQLFNKKQISIKDDFFDDLGGHSLYAAKVVSLLRQDKELKTISIIDIYQNRNIEKLADKIQSTSKQAVKVVANRLSRGASNNWSFYLCGLGQLVAYYLQTALISSVLLLTIVSVNTENQYSLFSKETIFQCLNLLLLITLVIPAFVIFLKWLLLGKIKPGHYKLWGWYYWRWWFVNNMQNFIPLNLYTGTPLLNKYYSLMGAKIGKNCNIGAASIAAYDIVNIGDNSSIGHDSNISGYIVEDGWLKIGSITIGERCFVGTRSVININTVMEDDSYLEDLSMLPENSTIKSGVLYAGSPAKFQRNITQNEKDQLKKSSDVNTWRSIKFGLKSYLGIIFMVFFVFIASIPTELVIWYFYSNTNMITTIFIGSTIAGLISFYVYWLFLIGLKKFLLGKFLPGSYEIDSNKMLYWLVITKLSKVFEVMADSLYYPWFLRSMGAKIGKYVETGELPMVSPDLLVMEDFSMSSGSVLIGSPRINGQIATFKPSFIKEKAFIGNIALLPPGTILEDNSLIGCLSTTPSDNITVKTGTGWLGSPAIFLPKRERFAGFSDEVTYFPSRALYLKRLFIEFIRILLPVVIPIMMGVAWFYTIMFVSNNSSFGFESIIMLTNVGLLITFSVVGFFIALKWILVGRLKPDIKPLWCSFIWRWDIIQYLEPLINGMLLPLFGTPFIVLIYRLLGAKLGKKVYLGKKSKLSEYDLITIGDNVCLNDESIIQTHLYEDRIFKMSDIVINNECTVGSKSIVLYNSVMGANSILGSLSLLMKGECLPENTKWHGLPAESSDS